MSIAAGFTDEELRAFVYEYERQPFGTKSAWMKEQTFTMGQFRRWRVAVYDGDLDQGFIPRDRKLMTPFDQRRHIANQDAQADADSEKLRARIRELEATNEALGKAIGLLHQLNEQGPATPETTEPPSS